MIDAAIKIIYSINPLANGTVFLLSAILVGCNGAANNAPQLTPELRAQSTITELFQAVNFAKKKGNHCATAAEYADTKHLQMAIYLSNDADNSKQKPQQKDHLYKQSEEHATAGLEHIKKKHCA